MNVDAEMTEKGENWARCKICDEEEEEEGEEIQAQILIRM